MESKKTDLFWQEMELMKTRVKLNKLVALNLSLYHAILDYAKRKGIPITIDSTILRLVEEVAETDELSLPLADENLQHRRNDGDLTVPRPEGSALTLVSSGY